LCGSGFYFAAIMLTLISSATMIWGGHVEAILPSRHAATVILRFRPDYHPCLGEVEALVADLGFRLAEGSTSIVCRDNHQEWHLVLLSNSKRKVSIPAVAAGLAQYEFLSGYQVAFARN
jgi:putative Mg2+ transporter-C (MgtC) family protein